MNTRYDVGAKQDFDAMTREMGKEVLVYSRNESLEYEGFEGDANSVEDNPMSAKAIKGKKEIVFLQELDSKNEVVSAGLFKVGDVKFNFLSNSSVEEESYVVDGKTIYKVLELTKFRGKNTIIDIRAFGKKLPNR